MTTAPSPRSTSGTRAEASRDRIMHALAEVAAEKGVAGFSVQDVADRAGVSHRTVYRHYENRDGLLDAFARLLDDELVARGGVADPPEAEEIPDAVRRVFGLFDDLGPMMEAFVMVSLGTHSSVSRRDERTRAFRRVLDRADLTGHLSEEEASQVTALVRTLASSNTWFLFRTEHDVDGVTAGRVVAWALETLLADLRVGGGPLRGESAGQSPPEQEV